MQRLGEWQSDTKWSREQERRNLITSETVIPEEVTMFHKLKKKKKKNKFENRSKNPKKKTKKTEK